MIKVTNVVTVYEIDGRDVPVGSDAPKIQVASHWNRNSLVVLEIDGKRYGVGATDLVAAVTNATNRGSH